MTLVVRTPFALSVAARLASVQPCHTATEHGDSSVSFGFKERRDKRVRGNTHTPLRLVQSAFVRFRSDLGKH